MKPRVNRRHPLNTHFGRATIAKKITSVISDAKMIILIKAIDCVPDGLAIYAEKNISCRQ